MHLGTVPVLLLCFFTSAEWTSGAAAAVEVNYGYNLLAESYSITVEEIVKTLTSHGTFTVSLSDASASMLRTLGGLSVNGKSVEVIIGLTNEELAEAGLSPLSARSWVSRNVVPHFPLTNIVAIAVGSDVLTGQDDSLLPFLVPAMRNIHSALGEVGLERRIKVSSLHSLSLLSACFPPSSAAFNAGHQRSVLAPLLEFLSSSRSFFMLNIGPGHLERLDKELSSGLYDPVTERHYANEYDVVVEALRVALASLNHTELEIIATKTGSFQTSLLTEEDGSSRAFTSHQPNVIKHNSQGIVASLKSGKNHETFATDLTSDRKSRALSSRRLLGSIATKQPKVNSRRNLADKSWCIAKSDANSADLQTALDWACGPGQADCAAIQPGQSCYLPNTVSQHASYAFNSYYQQQSWATGSCDFGGLAEITNTDPSTTSCLYKSSTSANGTPSTPTGTTIPNASSALKRNRLHFVLTSFVLVFLINRVVASFRVESA